MTRPRLTTLKSRLQPMPAPMVKTLETTAGATERIRGRPWMVIRERVAKAHNYLCVACREAGVARPFDEIDHVVPLERGGSNADSNLQPLCVDHHREKSANEARRR